MIEEVGNIVSVKNGLAYIVAVANINKIEKQKIKNCRVIFDDGRHINAEQRKKIYATIKDIADFTGELPEVQKEWLKYEYISLSGIKYFSLSDCTMEIATEFISFLIDFCFNQNIPTTDTMLNRTDDISHYLYSCLANRKCCICNEKGEVHHCEGSRVGMGFDRRKIDNEGRRAICLCRKCHNAAHTIGEQTFLTNIKFMALS